MLRNNTGGLPMAFKHTLTCRPTYIYTHINTYTHAHIQRKRKDTYIHKIHR